MPIRASTRTHKPPGAQSDAFLWGADAMNNKALRLPPKKRVRHASPPPPAGAPLSADGVARLEPVHALIGSRKRNGVDEVLVWWAGYPKTDATWQPAVNVSDDLPVSVNTSMLALQRKDLQSSDAALQTWSSPLENHTASLEARWQELLYRLCWDMQ